MRVRLDWKGNDLAARVRRASASALDRTAEDARDRARRDHPRWQTQTGAAEASIRSERAQDSASGALAAVVIDVPYGVFLERRDETLERAVTEEGGRLAERIRDALR